MSDKGDIPPFPPTCGAAEHAASDTREVASGGLEGEGKRWDVPLTVRAERLGRRFEDRVVLEDVSLEVPRGSCMAILGANGAGKTTLLRILATLLAPDCGQLRLLGTEIGPSAARRSNGASLLAELRRRIGYIGHEPMVYRELSARANLEFFGKLYGVPDPPARAQHLLEMMGLRGRADEPARFFSRGMVQRLAIARALVHDPDLLLADEPFSALDAAAAMATEVLMGHLLAAGKTIVMVSHDAAQSLRIAHNVVVLRRGRIVMSSPTSAVDERAVLAEVREA